MDLWCRYLEEYAEKDGCVEEQILVGCCHSAEILGWLAHTLDRTGRLTSMIEAREKAFKQGAEKSEVFGEHLANGAFGIYGHLQSLALLFVSGSGEAQHLIREVNAQLRRQMQEGDTLGAAAAAMRASFPLVSLMTMAVDRGGLLTSSIRQVEQRYREGAERAESDWDQLLNALYRIVEMMQMLVVISDAELRVQVEQIAARFEEEDHCKDRKSKMRNGFCRLFELGHLLTTHLDDIL